MIIQKYSTNLSLTNTLLAQKKFLYFSLSIGLLPNQKIKAKFLHNSITINNELYNSLDDCVRLNKKKFIKNKIKYLYLNPNELNLDNFNDEILGMDYFEKDKKYAFLIKLQKMDGNYSMAGNHDIWNSSKLSNEDIINLYTSIVYKLDDFIEQYSEDEIYIIQIMFIELNPLPKLKLNNINNLKLDKKIIKIGETKKNFNNHNLPLTMDLRYFGHKLEYKTNNKGFIDTINCNGINIFENIVYEPDNPNIKAGSKIILNKITDNIKINIYLYSIKFKSKYIIEKEFQSRHRIFIVIDNNNIRNIEVFDLKDIDLIKDRFGKPKMFITDISLNKDNSEFIRTINDFTLYINNSKISRFEQKIELPIIKYINPSKDKVTRNTNIGTLDIETYFDKDLDKAITYAIGYNIFKGDSVLFYKKDNQTSDQLILECIDSLLQRAYSGYTIYVHNLHGYDAFFILKSLLVFNRNNDNYYTIKTIFKDNKIIKLTISSKVEKTKVKTINLVDSYLLLPASLDKLANDFECDTKKGYFPYDFVNKTNLSYIGKTPDKRYYKNISDEEYNSIKATDWNLKLETLKYLEKDLESLMEVIDKFGKYIYNEYGLQITDALTISKLSINILYSKYLKKSLKTLPLIKNLSIYNFTRLGYYGGITEVYKPYGENLYYYDINSMYPFVAKNKMCSKFGSYIELEETEVNKENSLELDNLFGFFFCRVKTTDNYLGLLPIHLNNKLILPNGEFEGVWFSEELKFAKEQGYEIQVIKGYNYKCDENIFDNFVDDLYYKRLNSKGIVKTITKLILNSGFGRLGMTIIKPETKITNLLELENLFSTHNVLDTKKITNDSFIVTYDSEFSRKILNKAGIDLAKLLNVNNNKDLESKSTFGYVSVCTAAAITAYARIYINRIKLWILNNGGNLYYSDTDSIVTDIELPSYLIGYELGLMKLEHKVKKGYFISGKTYMLELVDGTLIKKSKGVNSNSLTSEDYINMYYNNKNITAIKSQSKSDFVEGSVKIYNKNVTLRYNSYDKREKLFDKDGLWINTRPLIFNKPESISDKNN